MLLPERGNGCESSRAPVFTGARMPIHKSWSALQCGNDLGKNVFQQLMQSQCHIGARGASCVSPDGEHELIASLAGR